MDDRHNTLLPSSDINPFLHRDLLNQDASLGFATEPNSQCVILKYADVAEPKKKMKGIMCDTTVSISSVTSKLAAK